MLIKKYGNRRLYDTEGSRYVTLEDLEATIRAGRDVRVVDARTGHDLTQATLSQIVLESRGAARLLPVPLLKQLIRMDDSDLSELFGRYMAWALDVYVELRRGVQKEAGWNPFAAAVMGRPSALSRLFLGGLPWSDPPPPSPPPGASAEGGGGGEPRKEDDIAELRREIEALKRAVARRSKR